ncbi:MAK10-like protein [Tanacetum coccineum]
MLILRTSVQGSKSTSQGFLKTSSNWLERLQAGSISSWEDLTTCFLAQFFPPGRTAKLRNDILMFQQHQGESLSESTLKTPDRGLLDLEDQINFLLKGPQPVPKPSSTHVPQAYVEAVSSNLHSRNLDEPPRPSGEAASGTLSNPSKTTLVTPTIHHGKVTQTLAHTERMERFENAIFKQREEINNRMTEMFGLLKELTTSRTPKKVLIREEVGHPVTTHVNSISLIRGEEEKSAKDNVMSGNSIVKPDGSDAVVPLKEVEKENEPENGTKNKPVESVENKLTQIKEEELVKAPSS